MTKSDELLIRSIPQALAETEYICSSVNVGSTKTGINMDAVRLMGDVILQAAEYTKENDSLGCAKLVVLCNAPDDNPFMAGAFHGVTEADAIIQSYQSRPACSTGGFQKIRNPVWNYRSVLSTDTGNRRFRCRDLRGDRFRVCRSTGNDSGTCTFE